MGPNNWLVQRALRSQAKRIAEWTKETYPVVKAQNEGVPDHIVHQKMLGDDFSGLSPGAKQPLRDD